MVAGIVYAKGMNENERYLTEYDLAEPIERCCATYPEECELGEEPCCDGCASGMGPCYGPGYRWVCYTHGESA